MIWNLFFVHCIQLFLEDLYILLLTKWYIYIFSFEKIHSLKIYNYQGVVNEDYNIANTPAPNGKLVMYVMKVMLFFDGEFVSLWERERSALSCVFWAL